MNIRLSWISYYLTAHDKSNRTIVVKNVIFADMSLNIRLNNSQRPGVKGVVGWVGWVGWAGIDDDEGWEGWDGREGVEGVEGWNCSAGWAGWVGCVGCVGWVAPRVRGEEEVGCPVDIDGAEDEKDGKLPPPDKDDVCCGDDKIAYMPIVPFPVCRADNCCWASER